MRFIGILALALSAATGCAGSSKGAICDVKMEDLAGSYRFSWSTHDVSYYNTCFERDYEEGPQIPGGSGPNPASMTGCTWKAHDRVDEGSIELEIDEDGDVGKATITRAGGEADGDIVGSEVECEMIDSQLCDGKVRCSFHGSDESGGDTSDVAMPAFDEDAGPQPEEWQYPCNCVSKHDPDSGACQKCKSEYEQYQDEADEYRAKGRDEQYIEFTLRVIE